ncbi:MAG: type II secretion system minor pseudopilin GspK [Gammaproteobacteria bacterium]|nr:type II secretion system minor pseudopilin GspK [Gammaproteobacteria bacterium]
MVNFIEYLKLSNSQPKAKQDGMALLMAIMIVALVAIVSVNMLTQRQLQIYRTANLYFSEQAYQYSLAIERWGVSVLSEDLKREKKNKESFDSYQDVWNTALVDFDVEQATLDGAIIDLQGRFNLNNLVIDGKVNKQWEGVYKQLLSSLGLPLSLSSTLIDWIDTNEEASGSDGAEDIYYIALEQPYRTSNQPLVNVSELFLIKGYTKEVIRTLKDHIYVASDETAINVNTSTASVLVAIVSGLSTVDAESILTQIEKQPFLTVEQFINMPAVSGKAIEQKQISVNSNYFSIISHVTIDKTKVSLQSVVQRSEQGGIEVINRQQSPWYEAPIKKTSSENSEKKNEGI